MNRDNLERFPLNATFELTARCNLQCKMCLIRIDNQRMEEIGGRERTTKEWIDMAMEIQQAGTVGLLLTGGEPMLRLDFIEIYETIAQMGFILTLYTNATLVTDEIMKVLKKYPPHRIGVTVYGASQETYEKVTGNGFAYYRMLKGVEQLKELPSKMTIRTTIIKDNLEDLDKIEDWSRSQGIEFNLSRIVTKTVRGGVADVEECRLTPEQSVAMLEHRYIRRLINPFQEFIKNRLPINKESYQSTNIDSSPPEDQSRKQNDKKFTLYGCDAGMIAFTITWDGKLIGCQMLGDCWTYPFEEGFVKAWEEYPRKVRIPAMPIECNSCKTPCSACPATRMAETGELNGLPQYLCRESRMSSEMEDSLVTKIEQIVEKERMI